MVDLLAALHGESARFSSLTRTTAMDADVPCCPDWRFADLVWHLGEVQGFWAAIVEDLLTDPDSVTPPDRPADADLSGFFDVQHGRLLSALGRRAPDDECWSWADGGSSVGWVLRRQAHEALIHRVDAEQAAGDPTPIDPALAADGVDEMLRVHLDVGTLPPWATYEPETTASIEFDDRSRSWSFSLGRFRGTSPATGTTYDLPAARIVEGMDEPVAVLRGSPVDLDLWLWGRGPLDPITVEGPRAVAETIRETAREATG